MLHGKTVLLGVSGSIAAYKAVALASALTKLHASVEVIMTENATKFISPLTFEQLTGNRTILDTFDRNFAHKVEHISLAKRADILLIAPATANICAKFAHGLADDMLTTTALACCCPKLISPAMNTNMYKNPVTQNNLDILRKYDWKIITPASGHLACNAIGIGKMPETEILISHILHQIALPHDMSGKNVLITAGPTQESLDPIRYITNHSSGKMGYALAKIAMLRGANVTLISGPVSIQPPKFVKTIFVVSAQDMFEAVKQNFSQADFIFKTAAVADYKPKNYSENKLKKIDDEPIIALQRNYDILQYLGKHRQNGQIICGFSMETENMLENSKKKLMNKKVDMICANNINITGFGSDTNIVTIITEDKILQLPELSKEDIAKQILDQTLILSKKYQQ